MLLTAWMALAAAQPMPGVPRPHRPTPNDSDWPISSPDWPCEYGGIRSCLATYEGPELCAVVRPLCDAGSKDACALLQSSECACLAGDAGACATLAKRLAGGGDEALRVLKVLEGPCLAGVMTACTGITDHLLHEGRSDLARPWLVFMCDRGLKPECARLEALPPEEGATTPLPPEQTTP